MWEMADLPSLDDVLLRQALYADMPVNRDAVDVYKLRYARFKVDAHCIECGKDSIFSRSPQNIPSHSDVMSTSDGHFSLSLNCERDITHNYFYVFSIKNDVLTKIGQNPSLEDISGSELSQYRKTLGQSRFGEIKRATGLFSHGIGIGSFVYLRRVFESLIYEHHDAWIVEKGEIPSFHTMRMEEKIKSLKGSLPSVLVNNWKAYGILSKGIHELDEQSCLKYFPILRSAIIMILDQDYQAKKAAADEAELTKAIREISEVVK